MKKLYLIIIFFSFVCVSKSTETSLVIVDSILPNEPVELTKEEEKEVLKKIEKKIKKYLGYLERIGSRPYTDEYRQIIEESAANMFSADAKIEVSSLRHDSITKYSPENYFKSLDRLTYDTIEMKFDYLGAKKRELKLNEIDDEIIVDGDFWQHFKGISLHSHNYKDRTHKQIEVLAKKKGNDWEILFSYIKVIETRP